jgi:small subunit ribosomal protein S6
MKLYESLFLIEGARAAQDFDGTEKELLGILEKHGAKVRDKVRFEERKLAYAVRGHRRGAYLLAYFDADPAAIKEINVDLNLSEYLLRSLTLLVASGVVPEKKVLGILDSRPERSYAVETRDIEASPHEDVVEEPVSSRDAVVGVDEADEKPGEKEE